MKSAIVLATLAFVACGRPADDIVHPVIMPVEEPQGKVDEDSPTYKVCKVYTGGKSCRAGQQLADAMSIIVHSVDNYNMTIEKE